MSNSKISALTSATTPVAGTEVLPIVQSSATVKLAISDITPGLGTITAAKGGTGQTSYAVGDLLYANTTTTLAKLPDVATGNALISGGVGVAPSYGKIGLTTHVSGTLPTANGGTNLISFTANGVVYASSTSALATSSSLVFDGTNLGIGTTVPTTKLSVDTTRSDTAGTGWATISNLAITSGRRGMRVDTSNTYWIDYYNGSSWAAQFGITASSGLLLGTTNAGVGTATGFRVVGVTSDADRAELGSAASTNGGIGWSMYSTGAGAYRFYVGYGGTIYATSTTITGISDQRLKENIRDLDDGLASVMALKPRKFDWKENKGANIKNARGFIAQEFEQVFPDMIDEWQDPAPEGEEPYKAVRADLIPTLVKAIQEQQTLITSLTARIEALETK